MDFADWEPPQPTVEELRCKLGGPSLGDDELLMRYVVGNEDVEAMHAAGAPKEYLDARNSLLFLLQELNRKKDCSQIFSQKEGLSLTLEKCSGSKS